jgi:uncharacterized protein (DUF608 family)
MAGLECWNTETRTSQVAKCIEVGLPALILLLLFTEVTKNTMEKFSHQLYSK